MRKNFCLILLFVIISFTAGYAVESSKDKAEITKIIKAKSTVRADYLEITIAKNWAFVDIAEKAPDGRWDKMTCAILKKDSGKWKALAFGDPHEWNKYIKQMPADVKKAFYNWDRGHY